MSEGIEGGSGNVECGNIKQRAWGKEHGARRRAEEFEIVFLKTYGIKLRSAATSLFDVQSV